MMAQQDLNPVLRHHLAWQSVDNSCELPCHSNASTVKEGGMAMESQHIEGTIKHGSFCQHLDRCQDSYRVGHNYVVQTH